MSRLVSAPEVVEGCQPFPGFTNEGYGADLSSRDESERVVIEVSGKHGIRGQFGRGMQMKRVDVLAVDLLRCECFAKHVLLACSRGLLDVQEHQSRFLIGSRRMRPGVSFLVGCVASRGWGEVGARCLQ